MKIVELRFRWQIVNVVERPPIKNLIAIITFEQFACFVLNT